MRKEEVKKVCTECGKKKDLDHFYNAKNGKYGKKSECKKCCKWKAKERSKLESSKKKAREYQKVRRANLTREEKDKRNEYYRNRYKKKKEDRLFTFKLRTRTLIRNSIKRLGYKKESKTQEIIGCSYEDLIKHLEYTFKNRYGIEIEEAKEEVHIDHIVPIATAKSEKEVIKLNHYTNLQYLYASDNLSKGSKIDE